MKDKYADTNLYIRYVIPDHEVHFLEAKAIYMRASNGEFRILFEIEVVLEIEYVLHKVYKVPKSVISHKIRELSQFQNVAIQNYDIVDQALEYYLNANVDLVDAILFTKAKANDTKVISFDKDFKKIENYDKRRAKKTKS